MIEKNYYLLTHVCKFLTHFSLTRRKEKEPKLISRKEMPMAVLSKAIKKKLEHQTRKPQKLVMTLQTEIAVKSSFKTSLGKLNWNIWRNTLKSLAKWNLLTLDGVLKLGSLNVLQLSFSKRHLQPKRFWIVVIMLSITKGWMWVKYIYNHLNCFSLLQGWIVHEI